MLTCQEILDFLMQYLDGELPPEVKAHFEAHLAVCPPCISYMETYRVATSLCKRACAEETHSCQEVPEELVQAILAARRQQ
jgi:anti-sigma factor (TIGR02949 family)